MNRYLDIIDLTIPIFLFSGDFTVFIQYFIFAMHNPEIAQMADRIVRIEDGRIAASA